MSQRLVVFISSTVADLEEVRHGIRAELEARGIVVRTSEDPDFPVEPGVTSHDACLRAVRTSHVFVLLIASRFGGEYQGQNKSITWREWDEAMDAGLLPVVLVHEETNRIAKRIFQRRRALEKAHPDEQVRQIDARLRAEPDFADEKPRRHNLPGVQRFVDAVRKGHVDNWVHMDWDGSPREALRRVDARLGTALAVARQLEAPLRRLAERERLRTDAIHQVTAAAGSLSIAIRTGATSRSDAVDLLLRVFESLREPLLAFRPGDRHNLVVYLRDGDVLRPAHRVADPRIPTHGRSWRIGQGHVGLAVSENRLLVGGDIRHSEAWVPSEARPTDAEHYVSAVSMPFAYRTATDAPEGAFIVTSSRLDHFRSPDQVEVLTVATLVNTLVMLLNAGDDA